LFNEADFIVAPHGAGLANIFGANANSTLVELVDTNHFSYCYTFIADYLGLNYYQFKLDNKSGETLIDLSNFRVFIQSILKQS
jgi:capsular polysaccharide biosynthesis protein